MSDPLDAALVDYGVMPEEGLDETTEEDTIITGNNSLFNIIIPFNIISQTSNSHSKTSNSPINCKTNNPISNYKKKSLNHSLGLYKVHS